MRDRVGQVWDVAAHLEDVKHVYLVVDEGHRDAEKYRRWLHRALNLGTGEMTDLQEVDGSEWETIGVCVRYG